MICKHHIQLVAFTIHYTLLSCKHDMSSGVIKIVVLLSYMKGRQDCSTSQRTWLYTLTAFLFVVGLAFVLCCNCWQTHLIQLFFFYPIHQILPCLYNSDKLHNPVNNSLDKYHIFFFLYLKIKHNTKLAVPN